MKVALSKGMMSSIFSPYSGVDDGELEFGGDGEDDAAFGGAVEFGEDDAGDAGGFGEEAGLLEAVLAGGSVHDEETFDAERRGQAFRRCGASCRALS